MNYCIYLNPVKSRILIYLCDGFRCVHSLVQRLSSVGFVDPRVWVSDMERSRVIRYRPCSGAVGYAVRRNQIIGTDKGQGAASMHRIPVSRHPPDLSSFIFGECYLLV